MFLITHIYFVKLVHLNHRYLNHTIWFIFMCTSLIKINSFPDFSCSSCWSLLLKFRLVQIFYLTTGFPWLSLSLVPFILNIWEGQMNYFLTSHSLWRSLLMSFESPQKHYQFPLVQTKACILDVILVELFQSLESDSALHGFSSGLGSSPCSWSSSFSPAVCTPRPLTCSNQPPRTRLFCLIKSLNTISIQKIST